MRSRGLLVTGAGMAAIVMLLVVALQMSTTTQVTSPIAPAGEIATAPPACTGGQFVIRVIENGSGVLALTCAASSVEAASAPAACGAGNWVSQVTENSTGGILLSCTAVLQEAASNTTACAAGTFVSQVNESSAGALTLTCVAGSGGSDPTSTPSACAAGSFLTLVTETAGALSLTCVAVSQEAASNPAACPVGSVMIRAIENATGAINLTCSGMITRLDVAIPQSSIRPTLVQNTFNTFTSGTSGAKAFGSNLGIANTIIVCEGEASTSTALVAPTDTLVTSYISIASVSAAADAVVQCWAGMSGTGGADTVTGNYGVTCTATLICMLFIQEVSGTNAAAIGLGSLSNTATGTALTTSLIFAINNPLLLGFYVKTTAGTDTAGASYSLLNGESGSLKYLTEKSSTISGALTNFPATAGTATAYAGLGLVIQGETIGFNISLAANTNYVFSGTLSFTSAAAFGVIASVWIRQITTAGVTLQLACMTSSTAGGSSNNPCRQTDRNFFAGAGSIAFPEGILSGSIKVGANPVNLIIEFDNTIGLTNGITLTLNAGSFMVFTPSP